MKQLKAAMLAAALCCGAFGCLDAVGPPSPTPSPAPQPVAPVNPNTGHTDAEFWFALADRVQSGRVHHTDRLIAICKAAKESKDLIDAKRLAEVLPEIGENPEPITAENRDRIAAALRRLR